MPRHLSQVVKLANLPRSQAQQDAQDASAGDERGGWSWNCHSDCSPISSIFFVFIATDCFFKSFNDALKLICLAAKHIRRYFKFRFRKSERRNPRIDNSLVDQCDILPSDI